MKGAKMDVYREERKLDKAAALVAASNAWERMSDGDKAVVRFGMIPKWVADENPEITARALAVAMMTMAEKDGGMIA